MGNAANYKLQAHVGLIMRILIKSYFKKIKVSNRQGIPSKNSPKTTSFCLGLGCKETEKVSIITSSVL